MVELLLALGVGLEGRAVSVVFEFMAEGKAELNVPSPRRRLEELSSRLNVGRNGTPDVKSAVFGSSLLLVCR